MQLAELVLHSAGSVEQLICLYKGFLIKEEALNVTSDAPQLVATGNTINGHFPGRTLLRQSLP